MDIPLAHKLRPAEDAAQLGGYLAEMFGFPTFHCFGLRQNGKLIAVSFGRIPTFRTADRINSTSTRAILFWGSISRRWCEYPTDRGGKVLVDPVLVDISRSAGPEGMLNILFFMMTAEDDDGHAERMFSDLLEGLQPGHHRHRNIRDDEIPMIAARFCDQFEAILYFFYQSRRIFCCEDLFN